MVVVGKILAIESLLSNRNPLILLFVDRIKLPAITMLLKNYQVEVHLLPPALLFMELTMVQLTHNQDVC